MEEDFSYTLFKNALTQAANWEQFISSDEEKNLPFQELKSICIERCMDANITTINHLLKEIESLDGEIYNLNQIIDDNERDFDKEIEDLTRELYKLEYELDEIKPPNKTLNDIEKLEIIIDNWDKLTYDSIKTII